MLAIALWGARTACGRVCPATHLLARCASGQVELCSATSSTQDAINFRYLQEDGSVARTPTQRADHERIAAAATASTSGRAHREAPPSQEPTIDPASAPTAATYRAEISASDRDGGFRLYLGHYSDQAFARRVADEARVGLGRSPLYFPADKDELKAGQLATRLRELRLQGAERIQIQRSAMQELLSQPMFTNHPEGTGPGQRLVQRQEERGQKGGEDEEQERRRQQQQQQRLVENMRQKLRRDYFGVSRASNASRTPGLYYAAYTLAGGKTYRLGYYKTARGAARAYDRVVRRLFQQQQQQQHIGSSGSRDGEQNGGRQVKSGALPAAAAAAGWGGALGVGQGLFEVEKQQDHHHYQQRKVAQQQQQQVIAVEDGEVEGDKQQHEHWDEHIVEEASHQQQRQRVELNFPRQHSDLHPWLEAVLCSTDPMMRESVNLLGRFANIVAMVNRHTRCSAYEGVYYDLGAKAWVAHMWVGSRDLPLGRWADERSAAHAYDAAVRCLSPVPKRLLNFPDEDAALLNKPPLG